MNQIPKREEVNKLLAMSNRAVNKAIEKRGPPLPPRSLRPVLGYVRYSSKSTQHEATIEKQTQLIEDYCKRNNLQPPRMYAERGVSGRSDNRPVWKTLLRDLTPGAMLIAHESTRFARETHTFLGMARQVQAKGARVEFVNTGPMDSFYLTFLAAIAEYDYRSVVTRLRDGRVQAILAGKAYRRPPFGYHLLDGEMQINPETARWVRAIFTMRIEGASYGTIVKHLIANGVPTSGGRGKWSNARIAQVLYNPFYAGYIVSKRPTFEWETNDD